MAQLRPRIPTRVPSFLDEDATDDDDVSSLRNLNVFKLFSRKQTKHNPDEVLTLSAEFHRNKTFRTVNDYDSYFNNAGSANSTDDVIFPLNFLAQVRAHLIEQVKNEQTGKIEEFFKSTHLRFEFFHRIAIIGIFFVIHYNRIKLGGKILHVEFVEDEEGKMFHPEFADQSEFSTTNKSVFRTDFRTDICTESFLKSMALNFELNVTFINARKEKHKFKTRGPEERSNGFVSELNSPYGIGRLYIEPFRGNFDNGGHVVLPCDISEFPSREYNNSLIAAIDALMVMRKNGILSSITFELRALDYQKQYEPRFIANMFLIMQYTNKYRTSNTKMPMVSIRLGVAAVNVVRNRISLSVSNLPLILFRSITEQCHTNIAYTVEPNNYFNWSCGTKINMLMITANENVKHLAKRVNNRGILATREVNAMMVKTIKTNADREFLETCKAFLLRFKMIHTIDYINHGSYNTQEYSQQYQTYNIHEIIRMGLADFWTWYYSQENAHLGFRLRHFLFVSLCYAVPFSFRHSHDSWVDNASNYAGIIDDNGNFIVYKDDSKMEAVGDALVRRKKSSIKDICRFKGSDLTVSNVAAFNNYPPYSDFYRRIYGVFPDFDRDSKSSRNQYERSLLSSLVYINRDGQTMYHILKERYLPSLKDWFRTEETKRKIMGMINYNCLFGIPSEDPRRYKSSDREYYLGENVHDEYSEIDGEIDETDPDKRCMLILFKLILCSDRHLKTVSASMNQMYTNQYIWRNNDNIRHPFVYAVPEHVDYVIERHIADFEQFTNPVVITEIVDEFIQLKQMTNLTLTWREQRNTLKTNFETQEMVLFGTVSMTDVSFG